MNTYDLVIIGGGPAGSMAALTAARRGLSALMVERDPVIGSPVRCAEGVDHAGLVRFFEPDPRWIATTITRYYLVAPDGAQVEMNSGGERGYILERLVFDRMIAEEAAKAGAAVMTGIEATALSPFEDGYREVTLASGDTCWDVRARVVVAADGVESRAARWAGIATHMKVHDLDTCAQVTCAGADIDPASFSLCFTNEFAPGGYAWIFPKGAGVANIGLGITGDHARVKPPVQYLDDFLARFFPRVSVVSRTVGGVPCSGGIKDLVTDGLLVAGDAAHMANPLTGGGIINAMIAGELAANTAADALEKGASDTRALTPYTKGCERKFAAMNRRFYKVREGIQKIPDDRINAIAREALTLPVEKRTPLRMIRSAVMHQPKLLAILPKLVI